MKNTPQAKETPAQKIKRLKKEILIKESIQTYNNERPHLSLKMKTPNMVHEKACENQFTGWNFTN